MFSQAIDSSRRIGGYALTLYLFTKSDILTTVTPITLFALAAAFKIHLTHILMTIIWIWMHLLKFNISNQIHDPEEDRKNKPDRPLPAGRITTEAAADIRWLLVPICLAFSALYGRQALASSICVEGVGIWYNDFGGDKAGFSKNILTAVFYNCLEVGATIVAGSGPYVDRIGIHAVILSFAVFATTLHAQDFKDEEGDRAIGRHTLVTLFPTLSRISMMIIIPLWSICLSRFWMVDYIYSVVFVAYGMVLGARFMFCRTVKADKQSCKMYSLWYAIAYVLPGYWRFFYST